MPFPELKTLLVEKSWKEVLGNELEKPYMQNLYQFVQQEASKDFPIYPPPAKVFNAFNSCPFDKVKVVILGQVRTINLIFNFLLFYSTSYLS